MLGCDCVLTSIFVLSTLIWGRVYYYYLRQLKTQPVITLKLMSDSYLKNDRKYNVPSKLKSLKKGKSIFGWAQILSGPCHRLATIVIPQTFTPARLSGSEYEDHSLEKGSTASKHLAMQILPLSQTMVGITGTFCLIHHIVTYFTNAY